MLPSHHHSMFAPLRTTRTIAGALTLVALSGFSQSASSQGTRDEHSANSRSTVASDTGAFAIGRVDFSHFKAPGLCVATVQNVRASAERSLQVRDAQLQDSLNAEDGVLNASGTLHDRILGDSAIVSQLATVARSCAAHLRVDSVSTAELPDFLTLALFARDESLVSAVIDRWITKTHGRARDAAWVEIVSSYLSANPARVGAAQALIARMDTTRGINLGARLDAHDELMRFAMRWFTPTLARKEAEQIIQLVTAAKTPGVPQPTSYAHSLASAYSTLIRIARISNPSEVSELGVRAKKALADFPPSPEWPYNVAAMQPDSVTAFLSFQPRQFLANVGAPVDSFALAYVFPAPVKSGEAGDGNGSSRRPTLMVILNDNGPTSFGNEKEIYAREFAQLKRWHARYGKQLAIRVITPTTGYWLSGVPGSETVAPDTEAQRARALFQDQFQFALPVGVAATSFHQRPDGVRLPNPIPFVAKYFPLSQAQEGAVLVDAQGRLRYAGTLNADLGAAIASTVSPNQP